MSDEYENSGKAGSLVDPSLQTNDASETGNYPPEGDTTSSGGYGGSGNSYSDKSQRGLVDSSQPDGTDQSGEDSGPGFAEPQTQSDSEALNPYANSSQTKEEAEQNLASAYSDSRSRQYESGGAGSLEEGSGIQ
ncbi:hypothetical protein SISNIDRAFT_456122 [Sistotremastrum niveocremeum HHB9708]|uniref:Uncharacterized protein n=1 Tax=Sistotremastrum niveocremeum HHB9708 TaxID=1314777 RepID=A0A164SZ75_9AGAM|nr:hypothetical protein SISNIDRAFT_456122 [Sistotremastrum niveocremeum HHB9708]